MANVLKSRSCFLVEVELKNLHTLIFWMMSEEYITRVRIRRGEDKKMRCIFYAKNEDREKCEKRFKEYNDRINKAA